MHKAISQLAEMNCSLLLRVMFTAITDKGELQRLQNRLVRRLAALHPSSHVVRIGHQGGWFESEVSYSPKLDMWWTLGLSSNQNRYWNAFGLEFPGSMVNIVVELNYHVEGKNKGIACNWAVDDNGDYFLFHNGNIRGGRPGIGPRLFQEEFTGNFKEILVNGKPKRSVMVCGLEDDDIGEQIRYFVEEVRRIKYPPPAQPKPVHRFSDEFDGETVYSLPAKVRRNGNHGRVVNSLKKVLEERGMLVGNNGDERIDLFTYNPRCVILQIFEVKTSLSIQTLCTAIGQLQLYGFYHRPHVQKTFVCPKNLSKKALKLLNSLDISVLYFDLLENDVRFRNIDSVLRQR